jgi:hypothetical protein
MTKRWSATAGRDGQTKRQASKAMRRGLKVPERDTLKAAAPYYSPGSPRSLRCPRTMHAGRTICAFRERRGTHAFRPLPSAGFIGAAARP